MELARQLLQGKQEPFNTIRPEFLCELSEEEGEALNCCLGLFDSDLLLGTLYEFIETYIKHCPLQEHDQPSVIIIIKHSIWKFYINLLFFRLVEILQLVLYEPELPQLAQLPVSIKLNQAVATWKHIVHYYDQKDVDQH